MGYLKLFKGVISENRPASTPCTPRQTRHKGPTIVPGGMFDKCIVWALPEVTEAILDGSPCPRLWSHRPKGAELTPREVVVARILAVQGLLESILAPSLIIDWLLGLHRL